MTSRDPDSTDSSARATLASVAAAAGVSIGYVSRVLNGEPTLKASAQTRGRVLETAERLGYVPNHAGRSLRRRQTETVALVVPDVASSVFAQIINGADEEAARNGAVLLLARSERVYEDRTMLDTLVAQGRIDGVIFQQTDMASRDWVRSVVRSRMSGVLMNSRESGPWSTVSMDNARCGYVGAEALIEQGHSQIAIISGLHQHDASRARYDGFHDALRAHGLTLPRQRVVWAGLHARDGHEGARRLLTGPNPPTAIFVSHVDAAVGAMAEARQLGFSVPEDVSIIGMHDEWPAEDMTPGLTTVRTPLRAMGSAAMKVVLDMMGGGQRRDVVVPLIEPSIALRGSVARPR